MRPSSDARAAHVRSPHRANVSSTWRAGRVASARHVAPIGGPTGKVIALDISPAMLDVARQLPPPSGAPIQWTKETRSACRSLTARSTRPVSAGRSNASPHQAAARSARCGVSSSPTDVPSSACGGSSASIHSIGRSFEATARHLGVPLPTVAVSFSLRDAEELRTLLANAGFPRIEITSRSLEIHLPAPERFVQLTVLGAASSVPAFARLGEVARSALVEAVSQETNRVASRYSQGNNLAFPMSAHIALAHASSVSRSCE